MQPASGYWYWGQGGGGGRRRELRRGLRRGLRRLPAIGIRPAGADPIVFCRCDPIVFCLCNPIVFFLCNPIVFCRCNPIFIPGTPPGPHFGEVKLAYARHPHPGWGDDFCLNLAQSDGARAPKRSPKWSFEMHKNAKSLEKVGGKVRPRNQA